MFLWIALLGAMAQSAGALQLGATHEELVARHGPPGMEDHARNLAMYFWDGWSARLEFQGSVVGKITYRRNWYLQEEEITSLLDANGGAQRWTEISDAAGKTRLWTRDDGAAAACPRYRPLSIVFESGLEAADSPAGPKGAAPAAPAPKPPSEVIETVSVAEKDAPASTELPTAPENVSKSDQSDRSDRSDRSDQSDQTPKSDQAPKAPQPAEQIPQHRPVSVTASPHGVAYSFGVLGILTLAVSGISFLKRRPRPI